jgi:hypothetical protein
MDTNEGRPLARSEDKYRRVCRKLIHHHAHRAIPYLTPIPDIMHRIYLHCITIPQTPTRTTDISVSSDLKPQLNILSNSLHLVEDWLFPMAEDFVGRGDRTRFF